MKEYRTYHLPDNNSGRTKMEEILNQLAKLGWILKSKEVSNEGYDKFKTAALGAVFLPLALLGRKENVISLIFEREKSHENDVLDDKAAEKQRQILNKQQSTTFKFFLWLIAILFVFFLVMAIFGGTGSS